MADQTQARTEQDAGRAVQAPAIDVRKLADKVYRLMLEDLRLQRARGGAPPGRREAQR